MPKVTEKEFEELNKIFNGELLKHSTKPQWKLWLMSLKFWKYQQVWKDWKLIGLIEY